MVAYANILLAIHEKRRSIFPNCLPLPCEHSHEGLRQYSIFYPYLIIKPSTHVLNIRCYIQSMLSLNNNNKKITFSFLFCDQ
jgi:hypothetical protein